MSKDSYSSSEDTCDETDSCSQLYEDEESCLDVACAVEDTIDDGFKHSSSDSGLNPNVLPEVQAPNLIDSSVVTDVGYASELVVQVEDADAQDPLMVTDYTDLDFQNDADYLDFHDEGYIDVQDDTGFMDALDDNYEAGDELSWYASGD